MILRVVGLATLLLVFLAVGAAVTGVARPGPTAYEAVASARPPSPAAMAAFAPVLFCLLVAAVFSWMVLRSGLSGWPLVAAVFFAHFGLGTVMFQIESAIFLPRHLPAGFVPRLFAMGAIVAALFAPAAVWMHGRFRSPAAGGGGSNGPRMATNAWILRLTWLAAAYVTIYFVAGYFIAFRNPDVLAYYDDFDAGSFGTQLRKVWAATPWLFALQAVRGLLWVAFVFPFLASFRGRPWELPLLIAAAYSVWALMLLVPNPYMPESVRMSHLAETGSSNFLYGCLVGAAWGRSRAGGPP